MRWLLRWLFATSVVLPLLLPCSAALAQEESNPDVLRQQNNELRQQLKDAQDRKNELAVENEKLKAKIAEQEKEVEEARRERAKYAERTFLLRSHYAAWETFIQRYPGLMTRWKLFIQQDPLSVPHDFPELLDPEWPLSTTEG